MLLDKALILKGLAGVAAVGGIAATGGFVFKDQIKGAISSSPQGDGEDAQQTQQDTVTQGDGVDSQRASEDSISQVPAATNVPAGVPGAAGASPSEPGETEQQKKKNKMTEINGKLDSLGLGNCHFTEGEITNINDFSRECTLDEDKFKSINFSNKGTGPVTVSGWSSNINLKIENKSNKVKYTFKNAGSKLTISGDPTKTNIVLKDGVEREFEENGGKLKKVSKTSGQEKTNIKALNGKLGMVKIPAQCRFEEEENDTSIECDVSDVNVLKRIDFANKDKGADSRIVGSTSGLKMTINRLSAEEAKLKHDYPATDLEFIFGGYSEDIKIQDNKTDENAMSDIVLKHNTNPILTINENEHDPNKNRLTKNFNYYSPSYKLGLSCIKSHPNITCKPNTTVKLLNADGTDIVTMSVQESQTNTTIITITEDAKDYEQGIKFTVIKDFPESPSSSPRLEKGNYQVKYIVGKGWALSKKS